MGPLLWAIAYIGLILLVARLGAIYHRDKNENKNNRNP